MTAVRCPRRWCGELAVPDTDGNGRAVLRCDACRRNARGLCRDCPRKIPNWLALRCVSCQADRRSERSNRRRRERYAEDRSYRARKRAEARRLKRRKLEAYRARYHTDPAFHERERKRGQQSYQRQRERILAKKRAAYHANPEAQLARCKAWRDAHREENRLYMREHYRLKDRRLRVERRRKIVCKVCGAPMPQRMKVGAIRRVCDTCRPKKYVRYRERKRRRELEIAA